MIPDAPVSEQVISILKQNGCLVCHSMDPQLPFFSSLPVIGPKMAEESYHASRFTDLESKVKEDIDDVTLSMLDHAVSYNMMPPAGYRLAHWGTGFNNKEKSVIAGWGRDKRDSDEPVCPIPDSVGYDKAKAELGESLFNDTRISLDGTISCATCHVLEAGGADHADERVSEGINGLTGGVNAPTVYKEAISSEERRGYEKFKENACITCHTGAILGGRSFEYLDIYGDYFADRTDEIAYNSDDDGLKGFTGNDEDLHKFKVPGLRNVALTAPYFHDGTLPTLEAAVKAMARYELGKELSDQDVCSMAAFMNTLTGDNPHMSK